MVSKKSLVWESAKENSRGIEECEPEFSLQRPERGWKNYGRNRSVYAKQNHCVFEAKVVCIFVAKLLCILAKQCVGKGGPHSVTVSHKVGCYTRKLVGHGRHRVTPGTCNFNKLL